MLSLDTMATMLVDALVFMLAGGAPVPTANAIDIEAVGVTETLAVTV
jgi:hypothetical protein